MDLSWTRSAPRNVAKARSRLSEAQSYELPSCQLLMSVLDCILRVFTVNTLPSSGLGVNGSHGKDGKGTILLETTRGRHGCFCLLVISSAPVWSLLPALISGRLVHGSIVWLMSQPPMGTAISKHPSVPYSS